MGFLRELFGPSKDEIWSQLAAQIGGQFTDGGFFGKDRVTAQSGQWTITLDTYTSGGKHSHTHTRMRAPFVNADGFRFAIYNESLFSPLGRAIGMQDIDTGDSQFDQAFVLKGNDEAKVRQLFDDSHLKSLLYAQAQIQLEVKDDEGWFSNQFPEHVDELYFERHGLMTNLRELHSLYELFAYSLNRLCHLGSAYEDDPGIRIG